MATWNDIVNKAKSQIGVKESPANSNNVKYNTEYYGKNVSGDGYAWCAAFVWWVFKECGLSKLYFAGNKTAYCPTLMNFYATKGQLSKTPRVGAIVFYDWNNNGTPEHVGIVESVTAGGIVAIEGNTAVGNDANGGCVMRRNRANSVILGYAYPYTDGSNSSNNTNKGSDTVSVNLKVLRNGSSGSSVKSLQILLNGLGHNCGTADGKFGAKTLTAVKAFQKKNGLTQDGVVGANTWSALLK